MLSEGHDDGIVLADGIEELLGVGRNAVGFLKVFREDGELVAVEIELGDLGPLNEVSGVVGQGAVDGGG